MEKGYGTYRFVVTLREEHVLDIEAFSEEEALAEFKETVAIQPQKSCMEVVWGEIELTDFTPTELEDEEYLDIV